MLRIISLGAGVQSTTMLLMALRGELPKPDYAIFADTGWEPKGVYAHLNWLEKEVGQAIPILRTGGGSLRRDVLSGLEGTRFASIPLHVRNLQGEPAILRRNCTSEYKLAPIAAKVRELAGLKPRQRPKGVLVDQWIGISVDEAHRMHGADFPWIRNCWPLIDKRMDRWDCILWLSKHGYPIPPKSACIGCPFHNNAYWRNLRDERPDEWRDAVEFDEAIRTGLRGVLAAEAFVHHSLRPLAEADLSYRADPRQLHLDLGEECRGMCGV